MTTGNWDPSSHSADELMKATVIILELAVLEQRAQILGGICIFDLGGISLQHAWQITPSIARRTVELMVVSYFRETGFMKLETMVSLLKAILLHCKSHTVTCNGCFATVMTRN
jgi:cell division FtsZ-interacting protein ZapD